MFSVKKKNKEGVILVKKNLIHEKMESIGISMQLKRSIVAL